MEQRAFDFIPLNERQPKPRTRGLTEIRGPYYSPLGPRYLEDLLETMGPDDPRTAQYRKALTARLF